MADRKFIAVTINETGCMTGEVYIGTADYYSEDIAELTTLIDLLEKDNEVASW